MSTLYWLTVLGNVGLVSSLLIGVFLFSSVVLTMFVFDKSLLCHHALKRAWNICITGFIISLIVNVMVPSKEELYAIYGVGSVIDYAKSSKEVQKIPDNTVKALNIYLEDIQKRDSMIKQEK